MFQSQTGLEIAVGTYGDFSLTAGGAWTYTLDDTTGDARGDATNALAAGQERIDAFTVTAEDGTEDGTEATVTITVTGANDAPTATVDDAIRSVPQNAMVTLSAVGSTRIPMSRMPALRLDADRHARGRAHRCGHRHGHLHRAYGNRGHAPDVRVDCH